MGDTVPETPDNENAQSLGGAAEGVVPVAVEIFVTVNPRCASQRRLCLAADDLERALWHRSNGMTWTQALLSVALDGER